MESNTVNGHAEPKSVVDFIALEDRYVAHNYKPLEVVIARGEGAYVWDVNDKKYYDFLSGYSAVSQGHCHPKIVKALTDQANVLTLTSRAFHNNQLSTYAEYACKLLKYDKLLPMNSGAEAGETAVKLARKWGYKVKGIPSNQAKVIFCHHNFWGRTIAACSSSSSPSCYENYGPYTPGFVMIDYNNLDALEKALEDPNVAAFYVEPVQGEAGVICPQEGYIRKAYDMCKEKNVLFIADEVQAGLCRTGYLIACEHDNVHPDVLLLGKALSGGLYPVSAVLANDDVILAIEPHTHGSTYGGNPLACAVARAALQVLVDEKLSARAKVLGQLFLKEMKSVSLPWIIEFRGRGALLAMEINNKLVNSRDVCSKLAEHGILTSPTHSRNIRFAPALVMTDEEMLQACQILKEALKCVECK